MKQLLIGLLMFGVLSGEASANTLETALWERVTSCYLQITEETERLNAATPERRAELLAKLDRYLKLEAIPLAAEAERSSDQFLRHKAKKCRDGVDESIALFKSI